MKETIKNLKKVIIGLLAGMVAIAAFAGSVTLAWNPSQDIGVVGYRIYYDTDGTACGSTKNVDAGNKTSVTVSNVVVGVQYSFVATCYTTSGLESLCSTQIVYTIPIPKPAPPTGLIITGSSPN